MTLTKEQIIEALQTVHDPELKLDIWTLKLIYDIQVKPDNTIYIKMTLTTPTCPYGPAILEATKQACITAGAKDVEIDVVFEPLWQPPEDLKWAIGAFSPWSA